MLFAVIMAGGKGTRFWPLSREDRPKQLLPIVEEQTMIQATVERLAPLVTPERIVVVTGAAHAEAIRAQLPAVPAANILAEPAGRNTAPCVATAAAFVAGLEPDATMAVFPADHEITAPDRLLETVRTVTALVDERPELLGTIGITPGYPETGYGYIERGEAAAEGVYAVAAFREKPDLATAEGYVAAGSYLWNSGMFFWKASTILDQIARHMPDLSAAMAPIYAACAARTGVQDAVDAAYPGLPAQSIDYGVMERAGTEGRVVVAPCDPGWNDVGSWRSLYDLMAPDADGNRLRGDGVAVEATGVLTHNDKRFVAVVGVSDVVVVETDDAVLVVHKDRAQEVRQVIEALKEKGRTDLL